MGKGQPRDVHLKVSSVEMAFYAMMVGCERGRGLRTELQGTTTFKKLMEEEEAANATQREQPRKQEMKIH